MRALVPISLLALSSCASDFDQSARLLGKGMEARAPQLERRTSYYDRERTRLQREWGFLQLPGGREVPHGRDTSFYANGAKEHEREYREGEPVGTWRSWWPNGNPRSEVPNGTSEPVLTRWWHENGALEWSGLARGGVREGAWEQFYANSALAARGNYVGGQQQGEWSFFDESGKLVESVSFRSGVRVRKE